MRHIILYIPIFTPTDILPVGDIGIFYWSRNMTRKEKGMMQKNQINMLEGPLAGKLIRFAMPIAACSILQQLFNSADVAVVGRFAGSNALAAVGANIANVGVFVNLLVGLSVGPNVVIGNLIGLGKKEEILEVVHTAVFSSIIVGSLLAFFGMILTHPVLVISGTPDEVMDMAELYLRIYLIGVPFIMVYNFGSAILRSIGDTKTPLYCLIISGIINIILNLGFVIGLHMGVAGVGLATVISNILSTFIVLYVLNHQDSEIHLDFRKLRIHKKYLYCIYKVGIPAGIQGMVFSVSNVFVQSGINSFGAAAIAGASAALNFEYFAYDVAAAFGQATVTFTSQNYAAGKYGRCKKIFYLTLVDSVLFTAALCGVFIIGKDIFIRFYSTDEAVIEYAIARLLHVMAFEFFSGFFEVGGGALRGMGYSTLPAVMTIIGTVGFRVLWIATVFQKYHSFNVLMNVYVTSWIFTSLLILPAYFRLRKPDESKS